MAESSLTKREELARALCFAEDLCTGKDGPLLERACKCKTPADCYEIDGSVGMELLAGVDAILDALMEPSERVLGHGHAAGVRKDALWDTISYEQALDFRKKYLPEAWQAMLRAIKNEPRQH